MPVKNPRYPHWCRIIRKTTEDPMEDEKDFDPMESDCDPMGGDTDTGSSSVPSDSSDDGKDPDEGCVTTVIYEGECRSYQMNTTSDKGDVITSQRGLALPLNQDGWDRLGVVPMEGDEVVVAHGESFKEYGRVIDKNVATASFAGTHLVWRYGRN